MNHLSIAFRNRAYAFFKQSAFIIPTAVNYSGLKGGFDLSPFTSVLKRKLENFWWKEVVDSSDNCYAYTSPILTPPKVLEASGHIDQFNDVVIDDLLTSTRLRLDHCKPLQLDQTDDHQLMIKICAPDRSSARKWASLLTTKIAVGILLDLDDSNIHVYLDTRIDQTRSISHHPTHLFFKPKDSTQDPIQIPFHGMVNPESNNPFLSHLTNVNLLLKSYTTSTDPIDHCQTYFNTSLSSSNKQFLEQSLLPLYLRPETAQGIYSQFPYLLKTYPYMKPPFGLAQVGKSFRNELRPEHYLFRSLEFEQMEVQYFTNPNDATSAHAKWIDARLNWWHMITNRRDTFRLKVHTKDDLAHYARACTDIEYLFPWGWGELEGICDRGEYDLSKHASSTGQKYVFNDQVNKQTYTPFVIESAAGLSRAIMVVLLDAYSERGDGKPVLKLDPRLSPCLVHILPVVGNRPDLIDYADRVRSQVRHFPGTSDYSFASCKVFSRQSIGKRYQLADGLGVPICITVDHTSLERSSCLVRNRDSQVQVEVNLLDLERVVMEMLRN